MPKTKTSRRSFLKHSAAAVALSVGATRASTQEKPIRIGTIYDLSGPFAAAGSIACAIGAQIAIDLVNERGGVAGKYKVEPINADSQSKADAAIAKVEEQKKILWITTAVATSVLKDKNLRHVFRAQIHSEQYGQAGAGFIAENAKAKLGMEPN